jgi:urease accessory protein
MSEVHHGATFVKSANAALNVAPPRSWSARLALEFERRGARSVLSRREQLGPLTLQKPFYPEGDGVCHCVILHPPGGIASGDQLELDITVGDNASALLTTPGAAKWYRSDSEPAKQDIEISVASGASVEWLPQESIFFDGAIAQSRVRVRLAGDALAFGWDVACLGRPAAKELFKTGSLRFELVIESNAELLWCERARLRGADALLSSAIGLAGHSVFATAFLAGRGCDADLVESLRTLPAPAGAKIGISALPNLLIARYLGDSAEQAKGYFNGIWALVRPALLCRRACAPRIWNT